MRVQAAPRIMAVAVLCAAALVALVVSESIARSSGQEALVPMEAIDPRALLQGHYVQLNLVQRLEPDESCPNVEDQTEWLAFHRGDGSVLSFAGGARSREGAQQIAPVPLKGSFTCWEGEPGWVQLDLGFDRFYIGQAEAERIERVLRQQNPEQEARAFAIVSVARDGRARLKGLVIAGERLELSWF